MIEPGLKALIDRYGTDDLLHHAVLLVDDEPTNVDVLGEFLKPSYRVHTAYSGSEALALIDQIDIDVVITDQRMPGMSGVDLLEQLRTKKPDVAGIVLTGFADMPAMIAVINRARVFRYLKKPVEPAEVFGALERASEHVYQARAIRRLVYLLSRRSDELAATVEELRKTQNQMLHLERLSTMGLLSAGVIHDLNNVMMPLMMMEDELSNRGLPEDAIEPITLCLGSMKNLIQTLDTMREFGRSKQLKVSLSPLDPATVVRDSIALVRLDMEFRNRRVEVRIAPDLPHILGDRHKLVQVMINLIRNAVHATKEGQSIVVEASLDAATGEVVLSTDDEGPGVPVELRQRLFNPFVSSKSDVGTGLGLYMCRLVMESHRGRIEFLNGQAHGARFEIRLRPASQLTEQAPHPRS